MLVLEIAMAKLLIFAENKKHIACKPVIQRPAGKASLLLPPQSPTARDPIQVYSREIKDNGNHFLPRSFRDAPIR